MSTSAKLAAFLLKLGTDPRIEEMREEFLVLFPGITKEEWMEGFYLHDRSILLLDAAFNVRKSFDVSQQMAALGWTACQAG